MAAVKLRFLFAIALLALAAILLPTPVTFATSQQSLVLPPSAGTFIVPNSSPFNNLSESRLAFRMHNWTFVSGGKLMQIGPLSVFFHAGPYLQYSASQNLCVTDIAGDSMPSYGSTACVDITNRSDILVLAQRAVTSGSAGELRLEIWDTSTGSNYASTSCDPGRVCPIATIVGKDFHGTASISGSPAATADLAWLQWYSTSVPIGGLIPKASNIGDLGNWNFNGNCSGSTLFDSGPHGLNIAVTGASCAPTPTYPPTCSISAPTITGTTGSINGFNSQSPDGLPLTYAWTVPSGVILSSASSPNPNVTVTGSAVSYPIELTVANSSSQTSCLASLQVVNPGRPPSMILLYNDPAWERTVEGANAPAWAAARFQYFDSPTFSAPFYNPPGVSLHYIDSEDFGKQTETAPFVSVYNIIADSQANDYVYENAFDHAKIDYVLSGSNGYTNMDEFDFGEGANGVLVNTTDETGPAYSGSAPFTVGNGSVLYIGYMEPFDRATFNLQTPRSGGSIAWQYWNGSTWASLTLASDSSSNLTTNGMMIFTPPSDWARHVQAGVNPKYWIRANVSGTTVAPVIITIKGDSWTLGDEFHLEGWNATDPNRVNVGLGNLEYNPTPPPGSSAHFRYQSRVGGTLHNNAWLGNIASPEWSTWLADETAISSALYKANGTFVDNVGSASTISSPPNFITTDTEWAPKATISGTCNISGSNITWVSGNTFSPDNVPGVLVIGSNKFQIVKYTDPHHISVVGLPGDGSGIAFSTYEDYEVSAAEFVNAMSTKLQVLFPSIPGGFLVCPNSQTGIISGSVGCGYAEDLAFGDFVYGLTYKVNANPVAQDTSFSFDQHIPPGNIGIVQIFDLPFIAADGSYHYYDRGNRGPINALAGFLMGLNSNMVWDYRSQPGFYYSDTDDYYYYSPNSTTLSQPLSPASGGVPIYGVDFSQFSKTNDSMIFGCSSPGVTLHIGALGTNTGEDVCADWQTDHFVTHNSNSGIIHSSWPVGTPIYFVLHGYQWQGLNMTSQNTFRWGDWFPAMGVNFGTPTDLNVPWLQRSFLWKTGASITGMPGGSCGSEACSPVWRRDFSNAVVLIRPFNSWGNNNFNPAEVDIYSQPIDLGGTYYPLSADGTVGPAITTIQLRAAESVILMKADGGDEVAPSSNPPTISSFSASPSNINLGGTATLSWNVTNASSVAITPGLFTTSSLIASTNVTPSATTLYTLTATNPNGIVASTASVTVTIPGGNLPTISSFSASPNVITSGQSTLLSWSVINATSLSLDNGIGNVTNQTSHSVTPITTTNYNLTATNASGTATRGVTVTVNPVSNGGGGGGGGSGGGGSSGGGGGGGGGFFPPPTNPNPSTSTSPNSSGSLTALLQLVSEVRSLSLQMFLSVNTGSLTLGSTGSDVWALQVYLITDNLLSPLGPAGSKLINPTSYFGSLTENALAAYQIRVGISPASGILGPKTHAYLESIAGGTVVPPPATPPTPTPAPTSSPALSYGSTGSSVSTLQNILVIDSYLIQGTFTPGIFDIPTERAVETFQCLEGIACSAITPGYGIVDSKTAAALGI